MTTSRHSVAPGPDNTPFSHKLRTAVFYLWMSSVTVIWFIPSLVIGLFLPLKARNYLVMVYYCTLVMFGLRWICGIRCEVEGRDNIPADGRGYVLISKHQSTWETFMLPTLIAPHVQVVKKELSYLPFFGWGLQLIQPIFIDRSKKANALKQVIQQGEERLKAGIHVLVFPEGSRIPSGKRKAFSKGGAMLASKTAAPVIPIAHNSGDQWPNTYWVKSPGVIRVVIGKPIQTEGMGTAEINELTESWINEQVDRISKVPFTGEYVETASSGKRF
jgi:1-acyl-sn-glycerol-3-phosphate acyltransferase